MKDKKNLTSDSKKKNSSNLNDPSEDNQIIKELKRIFPTQIKTDEDSLAIYGIDWTRYYTPNPIGVIFPKTSEDVQKIVQLARRHKVALVPSGGRTGLSGAAVAKNRELVVSFEKMNQILSYNEIDRTVTCQAGVITQELQNFARSENAMFPVDFAARGTSMVGGNVATNAGGINVIRYGLMRDWVKGLQVVTGSGEILNLNNGLVKNATGYDLRHLFIGSEGTLGFITEVTVKLTSPPKERVVLILGLNRLENTLTVFSKFKNEYTLNAFEFFNQDCLKHVLNNHPELSPPLNNQIKNYILVDIEIDGENTLNKIIETFEYLTEKELIQDGVISQSEAQAQNFWKYRDHIAEALSKRTPYKNDVSVVTSKVAEFMVEAEKLFKKEYPHFEVVWFGHIGDGNLHISILKPDNLAMDEFVKNCQKLDQILFSTIKKFNGSISAEHGVGLSKKPFLHFTRHEEEIKLMKGIKNLFDPDNIMNPGKIF